MNINMYNIKKFEIKDYNKGRFISKSVDDTISHGFNYASCFANKLILVQGTLGAGKTVWVKGLVWGLGIEADAYSPTFTIMNNYSNKIVSVFHLDLYRINHIEELHDLGLFEIIDARHTCVIEWPERLPQLFSLPHVHIKIDFPNEDLDIKINNESEINEIFKDGENKAFDSRIIEWQVVL